MQKLVLPIVGLLVLLGGRSKAAPEGSARALLRDERTQEVDGLFSRWDTPTSPGAVVAVIKNGDIIYKRAFGMADLERNVPLSVQSVFDIASTSKQFVALSILLLEEQKKLSLDDDIRSYLPEMPDYGKTITIRHLIHHTSGIRDYMDLMELAGMPFENTYHQSEIVGLVARQKALNFAPGEEFDYSNSGYLLLAEIIGRVSGQPLGDFAEEHIFKPLHMSRSQFYDDFTRIVRDRALSYSRLESGEYVSVQYIFDVIGDTGLLTTVEDLFLWDQNFYANKLGTGGPALIERMMTRGKLNTGEILDYACGLELGEYRGLKVVMHSGSAAGYRSQLLRFPEQKFTVIVLSNLSEFRPTILAHRVADVCLADEYAPDSVPAEAEPDRRRNESPESRVKISPAELMAYSGRYHSSELDVTYVVRAVDGSLTYHLEYSPDDVQLVSIAHDEFGAEHSSFRFVRNRTGFVMGFNLSFGRIEDIYFERTS